MKVHVAHCRGLFVNHRGTTSLVRWCLTLLCILLVQTSHAQQHIQFHTDRSYYFPGDTVWYKAYLMYNGTPDIAVRNLAVAIGRPNGEISEQQLRPAIKGASFGQYVIPRDYREHDLYFNLYSKRDRLSADGSPFATKVAVYQKDRVLSDIRPAVQVLVDGGGILPGLPNRATFRWNVSSRINGSIRDGNGSEIMVFRADAQGQASVQFEAGPQPLFLHWSFRGEDYVDPLPVCRTGARLRLTEINDTTFLAIDRISSFDDVTLAFSPAPDVSWEQSLRFGTDSTIALPVEELLEKAYSGDFLLRHLDSVLAHLRLDHYLDVVPELSVGEFSIEPYGRNSLDIRIPGHATWNLSVSVHDGLLPSLPGDMGEPLYERAGKYRYTYPAPGQGEELEDSVFTLKGQIRMSPEDWDRFWKEHRKSQQRLARQKRTIQDVSFGYRPLTEADFQYEEVRYDSSGHLLLRDMTFYDTLQTRVVQMDDRLKVFDYDMEWQFSNLDTLERLAVPDLISGIDMNHVYTGRFHPDYYIFPSGNQIIKEVEVSRKQVDPRMRKMQQQFSKGWFDRESVMDIELINEGIPDWVFTLDELTEYLRNKYPLVRKYGGMVLANNMHDRDKSWIGGDMPVDVTEIVFVRVYENYIQNPGGGGAIMYYTSGVHARNSDIGVAKIKMTKVPGYSGFLDFYHRDYNADGLPEYDDRQTLYWNPDIQLKAGVKLPVSFYNNSMPNSFTITIQGMSTTGRTFRYSKSIRKVEVDNNEQQ